MTDQKNAPPWSQTPNCFHCTGLRITHDPAWPYACQHFGFRSRNLPSREIERASGEHCLLFQPKLGRKG